MTTPTVRAGVYGRQSAGKAASITQQLTQGSALVEETDGWELVGTYRDGRSASRFATKPRGGWAEVCEDIKNKRINMLVLWESSRGDRTPETWFAFLTLCREQRVGVHVLAHERTYDLTNLRDWKTLAEEGVANAYETELLSVRTRRGVAGAAKAGRPAMGKAVYGYRRRYDPSTGKLVGQEPDPLTAPVAREVIERAAKGDSLNKIAEDLNKRGIAPPAGKKWYRLRVQYMALNPVYAGLRRHGTNTYPGTWEAIVSEATHYAAVRILSKPGHEVKRRPGKQVHLLTYLAECDHGCQLRAQQVSYNCAAGHVSIQRAKLDDFVIGLVLGRLAMPDVYESLRQSSEEGDREAMEAEGEIARLSGELDEWRASAVRGETSPASLNAIEAGLNARIEDARARLSAASIPPALRAFGGPEADVRARWDAAPLAAKRTILRELMTIRVQPSHRNAYMPVQDRVVVEWK